ncbi:MAG: sensor histidine kinase [Paucimonas sp.]|nr:sensor histidine kinase [Paucimonas sp.]
MNQALNTAERPLPYRLASALVFLAALTVFAALIVTHVLKVGDSFLQNLVFSACICTVTVVSIETGRRLLWRGRRAPPMGLALLILASVLLAYLLGSAVAALLLGLPPDQVIEHQTRNFASIFLFTLLASALPTWFFANRVRLAELAAQAEAEKARAAAIERQAMQTQLQLLQAQIEPHMLFNTLANLQGLIAIDPTRAQHMLDQLIQYLRATLSSSRETHTTLSREFELMQAYLGLMSVRLGRRLSYTLRLPETLKEIAVPPMLLQPLVENAIKHGIEPKVEGGSVDVEASREDSSLRLRVTDSGLGLAHSLPGRQGESIGLANVRERLQALFGSRSSFTLSPNDPAGAVATIVIPL